jgi:hypothetical protein
MYTHPVSIKGKVHKIIYIFPKESHVKPSNPLHPIYDLVLTPSEKYVQKEALAFLECSDEDDVV